MTKESFNKKCETISIQEYRKLLSVSNPKSKPVLQAASTKKRKPIKNEPTEAQVINAILIYLAALQATGVIARFWRNNTGALSIGDEGKKRFVRFGEPGLPDIIGIMANGRFLGLECKRPSGVISKPQAEFVAMADGCGAVCGVVRSIDDVQKLLEILK
jgi:hypothetical protein